MSFLLHIATQEKWALAQSAGAYKPDSLESEGFIHCSTPEQLMGVANELYAGQTGLLLLEIDPARVSAGIRFEDCYDTGQLFPHIYGELPLESVVRVSELAPDNDGRFDHHFPHDD